MATVGTVTQKLYPEIPHELISRASSGQARIDHFPSQSSISTKETSEGSLLKRTFKSLIDYSRTSSLGSSILKLAATVLYLTNGLTSVFDIDIGANKLIEGELNRKLFQPETLVKMPKEQLEMVTLDSNTPDEPTLHGYYFENPNSELAVIYLHGYNGSIFECHPECTKLKKDLNTNVLIVDYRSFGINEGIPTIDGVVRDTERMYDYLTKEKGFKGKNIIIYGVSLGGPVALETYVSKLKPQKKELGAIGLLYPFSSIRDITKWRYPEVPYNILPNDKLNSKRLAKYIDIPLHMAHGDADNATPCIQSFVIYNNAKLLDPSQKEIYVIEGVGHEDIMDIVDSTPSVNGYFKSLRDFIIKHFPEHKF